MRAAAGAAAAGGAGAHARAAADVGALSLAPLAQPSFPPPAQPRASDQVWAGKSFVDCISIYATLFFLPTELQEAFPALSLTERCLVNAVPSLLILCCSPLYAHWSDTTPERRFVASFAGTLLSFGVLGLAAVIAYSSPRHGGEGAVGAIAALMVRRDARSAPSAPRGPIFTALTLAPRRRRPLTSSCTAPRRRSSRS